MDCVSFPSAIFLCFLGKPQIFKRRLLCCFISQLPQISVFFDEISDGSFKSYVLGLIYTIFILRHPYEPGIFRGYSFILFVFWCRGLDMWTCFVVFCQIWIQTTGTEHRSYLDKTWSLDMAWVIWSQGNTLGKDGAKDVLWSKPIPWGQWWWG